mmetsp:Transcript_62976/g.184684  ORF Transcript_62976/g.184684 Transcript_62976/m.184684 type:complete len:265 (+) Transcript_62976:360-1154(+)
MRRVGLPPPGTRSTSRSTSFRTCSTLRQVMRRSRASFRTASTTPLQSPKRSGRDPFHFLSSLSSAAMSPSSMAACSGGSSRMACLMCSVTWRSVCSCSSVCFRDSLRQVSRSAFSCSALRSRSSLKLSIFRCISAFSRAILSSQSARKSASCCSISAFSSAMRWHSACDWFETAAVCSFSCDRSRSHSARTSASRCSAWTFCSPLSRSRRWFSSPSRSFSEAVALKTLIMASWTPTRPAMFSWNELTSGAMSSTEVFARRTGLP